MSAEEPSPPETHAPVRLGEFAIVREIGRGGMGVVYEAEQLSLKRRVALKVLPPGLGRDARLLARFQREAEAAGRLRHPGIVPVYSVGDASGTPYFAMELVEGRSLAEILRARRAGEEDGLPPRGPDWIRWAVATIARVAEALAYAHGQGILHRDVKPGNVLIDRDGAPRLTDFGLALDLLSEGLTLSGEVFGSLQYMSPEQAFHRGGQLDCRTDVYSLAATLYELVTLRHPYRGETSSEILLALESGAIVPPRSVEPAVSEALERVLLHGLAKEPAQRYADAALFAADLRALEEAREVAAPRAAGRRRRRRFFVVAAVLVIALAGGDIAWNWYASRSDWDSAWDWSDALDKLSPLSAEEIRALADGTLKNGSARLLHALKPTISLRRVLARNHLGRYWAHAQFNSPTGLEDDLVASAEWRVSVAGGPWKSRGTVQQHLANDALCTLSVDHDLGWLLEGSLEKGSVEVVHEGTFRIQRVSHGVGTEETRSAGTSATFTDRRVLLIYDEYPPDYPEAVGGEELDKDMRSALTPRSARKGRPGALGSGEKTIPILLMMNLYEITIPVASEIDLFWPGHEGVSATAELVLTENWIKTPLLKSASRDSYGFEVTFVIAAMPPEEEARFLLDLESGRTKELHFVMRPSRRVALEKTILDRYWAGTLEATVPLVREP